MKRFAAIILLSIHLFNMGGYALLFQYYIHKSDVQMVKQIFDNKIDNKKFIEIKIPVNMPTIQDWTEYEVVQGQINVKGTYYNYVKLKMTRDTTYFICIANTAKTQLVNAKISTSKEINDIPQNKKTHDAAVKKASTLSEYNLQAFQYHYHAFETQLKPNNKSVTVRLNDPFIDSPGKPPNAIS
ncbi:hypothetical protein KXD93_03295 [Mucilaginibacter sp. BJC16-A38]|uniref:hypothetical protein n=1 Tax=Mucilaginibacter phenanthrenivorans TaxID=1234842 RepID=UPI002158A040|nr:hypothetical protein [Mucilaginibacter phenanthrenivorans]MCR8556647.1 hypothetical protein [Mucilaginibacter phenanthrenivorans]